MRVGRGDLGSVLRAAVAACDGALATVVAVEGSAYRRPGARLWVPEGRGLPVGSVSAGCLETEVVAAAAEVAAAGRPRLLRLDARAGVDEEWGWGLGCAGVVDVLFEPVGPAVAALEAVLTAHRSRQSVLLATVVEGEGLARHLVVRTDGSSAGALAGGAACAVTVVAGAQVLIEVLEPPPRLVICGAGDDAIPLAELAGRLGWAVEVVDDRPARLVPGRFSGAAVAVVADPAAAAGRVAVDPATAVVVMTHHLGRDRGYVGSFLSAGAAYLGVLGPRARLERILADLGTTRSRAGVRGPVGLALGAEGAPEIAVAVVAEILAVLNGNAGGPGQPGQDRWRASVAASRAPL